jgi:ParB-like chromosome segregation protein Spo0J
LKLVKVKISELKAPEKNVRNHSEKQIKEFVRSLEKFGQIRPVVIDENNIVYCGNGLVEAAKSLGWEKIEALRKVGMTEADKKKMMIADNRIYSLGSDNYDNLNAILEEIGDFDVPSFDVETLEAMFGDVEEELSNFGILDDEEKEQVQKTSKQEDYGQTNYFQNGTSSSDNFQNGNNHDENSVEEESSVVKDNFTTENEKLVCPNCGHEF